MSGDRGKGLEHGRGTDRGKGPVPSTISTKNDEYISDEEVFESINPLQTITLALRKANKEFRDLITLGPTSDEDLQRVADLSFKIENYGNFVDSMRGRQREGPGSNSRTTTTNLHGHVAMRLFATPNVAPQTDSIPSRGDATPSQRTPDRAGGVRDHGTDHDSTDCYPGATRIQSTGTTTVTYLVDEDMVPIKVVQLPGNNVFYNTLHDTTLELFGPTIRLRWNQQDSKLKSFLITKMVGEFGDSFNKPEILKRTGKHLKHVREAYRNKLVHDPKCECPLMVPEREWKEIIADAREIVMKAQGKTPPGPGRLQDTSKATKGRQEKHGQHKLGQGGYGRLKARIGDMYNDAATKEDLEVGFTQGFDGVLACRRSLEQSPCVSLEDMESNNATNAPNVPHEPHPNPNIDSSVVGEGPLHSGRVDADGEQRSASIETTMQPPTTVSTEPTNPAMDAHAQPQPPRRNTRSSTWREVLHTDDATLQEGPRTVGDQLGCDDELLSAFIETKKKKKKKNK